MERFSKKELNNKVFFGLFANNLLKNRERHQEIIGHFAPDRKALQQMVRALPNQPWPKFPKINMNAKQMLNVVLEFFKETDEELYNRVQERVNNKEQFELREPTGNKSGKERVNMTIWMEEKEPWGVRKSLFGSNKPFTPKRVYKIIAEPENTIMGIIVLAHELMHACSQRSRIDKRPPESVTCEIESRLVEFMITDYMLKKEIITPQTAQQILLEFAVDTKSKTDYILRELDVLEEVTAHTGEINKGFIHSLYQGRSEGLITDILNAAANRDKSGDSFGGFSPYEMRYVFGSVMANAWFMAYKKDPSVLQTFKTDILDKNWEITREDAENRSYAVLAEALSVLPAESIAEQLRFLGEAYVAECNKNFTTEKKK